MKKFIKSKKGLVALLAALTTVAIGAFGAYAYWTNSGTGSGTAATGTNMSVVVKQTTSPTAMYPGGPTQQLSGNFDNPNSGATYVTSVDATISSVTGPKIDAGHPCVAADYQLNGFPVAVGQDVPAGNAKGTWGGTTTSIQMLDSASNQDGCKGATVQISYTSA